MNTEPYQREDAPSSAATGEICNDRVAIGTNSRADKAESRHSTSDVRAIHAARDLIRITGSAAMAKQIIDKLGS